MHMSAYAQQIVYAFVYISTCALRERERDIWLDGAKALLSVIPIGLSWFSKNPAV